MKLASIDIGQEECSVVVHLQSVPHVEQSAMEHYIIHRALKHSLLTSLVLRYIPNNSD